MKYKAVLFDLDGTLLDTIGDLGNSMNATLRHFGLPEHPLPAYKYFVGDGLRAIVTRALPENRRDEESVVAAMGVMSDIYNQHWADLTVPYPGIPELLDALTERKLQMGILTNKPDVFTKDIVATLLPGWPWGMVQGAKPDVPRKPDPTAALDMAQRFGVPPADFLYLGDTNTDMLTACAAGMFPVGVLWGFRPAEELLESGAKVLIEHPLELLRLLED